ncbi:hypothetical protein TNIN_222341 [Trichonephila inaurata madagascariensis]|uniref:Uncharacterized protein n=1 Tax=Trichonephila inaurata madagascariensis TaxID=2747483 RepID=A0A8X6XGC4_9ARAC|nr:hypothetical protein TNIN_222341 [Trichonephila inaurata madagascariensis]
MSPFYFKILYKTPEKEMYVFGLIADGEIYFKACDLGHLLGYRNVSNVLGCHMETKKTVDLFAKKPRPSFPIPEGTRIVELSQIPLFVKSNDRPPPESVEKLVQKRCKFSLPEPGIEFGESFKASAADAPLKKKNLFVVKGKKNPEISLKKFCKLLCLGEKNSLNPWIHVRENFPKNP